MEIYILIADLVLITLLLSVLWFGWRVAKSLKVFSKSREDMQRLVLDISEQITIAQDAVKRLKETAKSTGKDLEKEIEIAKALSDELQFINEAAENLANRLERGAGSTQGAKNQADKVKRSETSVSWIKEMRGDDQKEDKDDLEPSGSPFAIRDPEFEKNLKEDPETDHWSGPEELETKAERELYEALKSKKVHN